MAMVLLIAHANGAERSFALLAATPPTAPQGSEWRQLPPGCLRQAADDIAKNAQYALCREQSGFTFDVAPPVAPVNEDAFCRSQECLQVIRWVKAASLPCAAVKGLKFVALESFEGRERCFGAAGNDDSIKEIVRPASAISRGSGSGASGIRPNGGPPTATTATSNDKVTSAKSTSGMGAATFVLVAGVVVVVVGVVGLLLFAARRQKQNQLRISKHHSITYDGFDTRHSTVPIIEEISTPQSSQYSGRSCRPPPSLFGIAMLQSKSAGPTPGFSSLFAGWDEELLAAVRVPYEKLTFEALVSRGGFGEVYRGSYRGQLVAIKTLLPDRRRDMRQIENFLAEIKIMAAMEHERIVRFVGVAWDSLEELCVVTEFLSRGDLRTVLAAFDADAHGFDAVKTKIALHVAHALTYMHTLQPVVLHRDLKSRNILLDDALDAKITDFGVSRERADRTMTAGVGSSLWMAPEVMLGERYDEKADVFSFGVVLSELDTHTLPYADALEPGGSGRRLPDAVILQMVAQGRMRVAFTDEQQSEMAQIGLQCVALAPEDRPTAGEVLHLIHQIWKRQ